MNPINQHHSNCDIVLVGGGIVGLATGLNLMQQYPSLQLAILEKESQVATHQTGHNSGVIHAGLYYKPESLRAKLCVDGVQRLIAFCVKHHVRYELCGKVVVAVEERELGPMEELYRRGTANGIPGLRKISKEELREIEPSAAGIAALYSPQTGIINYGEVSRAMAAELTRLGASIITGAKVEAIHRDGPKLRLQLAAGEVTARYLINCAGLHADLVAKKMGLQPDLQIIPFRGEYYFLRPERQHLVRGLIYPVPDARLPFLGVHFTKTIDGRVEAGPNAVLAFAREGYTKGKIAPSELLETLRYPGFRKLVAKFWRNGCYELYRSFSKAEFVRALQRLVPAVQLKDIAPGGAGVRAQAVTPEGNLADDFRIVESPGAIHLLNAPSPAATASLAIGHYIATLAATRFSLGDRVNSR